MVWIGRLCCSVLANLGSVSIGRSGIRLGGFLLTEAACAFFSWGVGVSAKFNVKAVIGASEAQSLWLEVVWSFVKIRGCVK